MNQPRERGKKYNTERTGGDSPESALTRQKGLDFSGNSSVNPKEVNGGTPMESTTQPTSSPALDDLEQLLGITGASDGPATATQLAQAVVYLRVSTPRQMHTASDIDEDGNSIATQRVETSRKVRELKATVAREFVEPGQSAQTISKRTEFKRMLRYIDEHPEVKYVVIYMRSRVFRNFTDAAITKRELLEKGVRLISAKEEFGDGYMADAMEAITDLMNEVQVRMNGEDVKVKMKHKVEQGGSIGRAKLGYLNVRKEFNGRLVNTIDLDPERAPLVTYAFEQYATGRYSIAQLTALMNDHGLTMRASPSKPSRPINKSSLANILRDPYYTGVIRYKGKLYAGRHEAIVSKEVFVKVQEHLNSRKRDGDRDQTHFHYLRGMLACGKCRDDGRLSRLVYSQNTGNGGTYEYFICTARNRQKCSTTGFRAEDLEDKILEVMAREQFDTATIESLEGLIAEAVDSILASDTESKAALQKEYDDLEAQEERLIELAAGGGIPTPKLRERLEQTTLRKGAVAEQLAHTTDRLKYGADTALAYLELLRDPAKLYRDAPDEVRRDLLNVFFERLRVYRESDGMRIEIERSEAGQVLHDVAVQVRSRVEAERRDNAKAPRDSARSFVRDDARSVHSSLGVNKELVAGVPGLEPRTTEPESAVLPITPYPKGAPAWAVTSD